MVVIVEEAEIAMAALHWAVRNFLRRGDWITLLHVFPITRSTSRQRILRLRGFQLALSFRDACDLIPDVAAVDIIN